jgi:hypothetical protein
VPAGTQGDPAADDALVGVDRQVAGGADRRDGAALVAGRPERGGGVGHRELVDADDRAQLLPGDAAAAGHQREQEPAVVALDDQGLDDVAGFDAEQFGGLVQGVRGRTFDHVDRQATGLGVGVEPGAGVGRHVENATGAHRRGKMGQV